MSKELEQILKSIDELATRGKITRNRAFAAAKFSRFSRRKNCRDFMLSVPLERPSASAPRAFLLAVQMSELGCVIACARGRVRGDRFGERGKIGR